LPQHFFKKQQGMNDRYAMELKLLEDQIEPLKKQLEPVDITSKPHAEITAPKVSGDPSAVSNAEERIKTLKSKQTPKTVAAVVTLVVATAIAVGFGAAALGLENSPKDELVKKLTEIRQNISSIKDNLAYANLQIDSCSP
jgi:hypothetical protein